MNTPLCVCLTLLALTTAGCATVDPVRVASGDKVGTSGPAPSVTVRDCHRVNLGSIFMPGKVQLKPEGEAVLSSAVRQIEPNSEVAVEVFPHSLHRHSRFRSSLNEPRAQMVANFLKARNVRVVGTTAHSQPRSRDVAPNARVELVVTEPSAAVSHAVVQ